MQPSTIALATAADWALAAGVVAVRLAAAACNVQHRPAAARMYNQSRARQPAG